MNLSSYTLLATPANYQASTCYASPQQTLALGGKATSNLCLGTVRLALLKGCPKRGEKEETALTKISQKTQKEGRAPRSPFGKYKVWPSQYEKPLF